VFIDGSGSIHIETFETKFHYIVLGEHAVGRCDTNKLIEINATASIHIYYVSTSVRVRVSEYV
jgi:hypothetical protein